MTDDTSTQSIDIGILGGSGVYRMDGFSLTGEKTLTTPFGAPSDSYLIGTIGEVRIAFLPRHGRNHHLLPSEINYRANIYGFKTLGVQSVLAITAVGSLREERPPLDLVIPDQLVDNTVSRIPTFFGNGVAAHIPFAEPFCPNLCQALYETAKEVVPGTHMGGTLITIDGPAFSTRAESNIYRQWGCDIIGMTTYQEAKLCREAEICYAALAMITDYDCWKTEHAENVNVQTVMANMTKNSANAQDILRKVLPGLNQLHSCSCRESLKDAIMTARGAIPDKTRERLSLLLQQEEHLKNEH